MRSRREFLIHASLAVAAASFARMTIANPLGKPIGIQLYTVNDAMEADAAGTLKAIARDRLRRSGNGRIRQTLSAKQFRQLHRRCGPGLSERASDVRSGQSQRAHSTTRKHSARRTSSVRCCRMIVAGPNARGPMTLDVTPTHHRTRQHDRRGGAQSRPALRVSQPRHRIRRCRQRRARVRHAARENRSRRW